MCYDKTHKCFMSCDPAKYNIIITCTMQCACCAFYHANFSCGQMGERMLQPASQGALQTVRMVNWCLNKQLANHLPILARALLPKLDLFRICTKKKCMKKAVLHGIYAPATPFTHLGVKTASLRRPTAFVPKLVSLLRIGQCVIRGHKNE
jgi:hypothetical protein